jgi:hypothetical protein
MRRVCGESGCTRASSGTAGTIFERAVER